MGCNGCLRSRLSPWRKLHYSHFPNRNWCNRNSDLWGFSLYTLWWSICCNSSLRPSWSKSSTQLSMFHKRTQCLLWNFRICKWTCTKSLFIWVQWWNLNNRKLFIKLHTFSWSWRRRRLLFSHQNSKNGT